MNDRSKNYAKLADIPTDVLASRFVGTLIMAKGNLNKYEAITAHLIRELRGELAPAERAHTSKECQFAYCTTPERCREDGCRHPAVHGQEAKDGT